MIIIIIILNTRWLLTLWRGSGVVWELKHGHLELGGLPLNPGSLLAV